MSAARRLGAKAIGALLLRAKPLGVRIVELPGDDVLKASEPPATCPTCGHPALHAVRDPNGDWTWSCLEGCNP